MGSGRAVVDKGGLTVDIPVDRPYAIHNKKIRRTPSSWGPPKQDLCRAPLSSGYPPGTTSTATSALTSGWSFTFTV